MILLNLSHTITKQQNQKLLKHLHIEEIQVINVPPYHFNPQNDYVEQFEILFDSLPISIEEIQKQPIIVNLPSYNIIASLLLVKLHGIIGHFPTIIRMREIEGAMVTEYEIAEIINLQNYRNNLSRTKRVIN